MRQALTGDGSRIWVDSRGLLHLKSSDPSLPEMTLVLANENVATAGWISSNLWHGEGYYIGDRPSEEALIFYNVLRRFAARLRGAQP